MKKKDKRSPSAEELSEKAMFYNPCVCTTETTGYVQQIPEDKENAESLSDITEVPVAALDGSSAHGKAR